MATINIGSLSLSSHKGDYDNSTSYVKNDVVYYATTGSAYIAKQATTGNLPTSTAHWNVFAAGSGGIWNAGLSLGAANSVVKVNSSGTALEFGAAGGANTPAFFVSKSSTQSIANNTTVTLTFDTEAVDTDNAFASNSFTVPSGKGGIYCLFAQLRMEAGSDYDTNIITLRVNGTNIAASWWSNIYYDFGNIFMIHNLSDGDVVTATGHQNSGSTGNIGSIDRGPVTFFGGYKLIQ
tara:strand:+ start:206 stop:913 length:708 start_codon:yes stop_codon:yes gene_type:complete